MKKFLSITALTAGLALSGTSMAGTLFTPAQTQNFNFSSLTESTDLLFNGFDSSLGTLTSVHLSWTLDTTLNSTVFNTLTTSADIGIPLAVSATSTATFSILGQLGLTDVNTLTTPGFVGTVLPGPSTVGTISSNGLSGATSICSDASCTGAAVADLSAFVGGAGLFSVNIDNVGSQGGSVPAGVFTGNDGTATGAVSIVYDYDGAPTTVSEPMTIALLGLGLSLIGLQGAAARRRKKA